MIFCLCSVGNAAAGKRVALVIGNSAYRFAGVLDNPKNDAADVAAALRRIGFAVIEGIDLDKSAFDRKIRDFATELNGAEAGLFFYAGHGLQVGGQNYLVPIDAELTSAAALDFEMVRMDLVHRTMEREAQTNIIFLDACRNNPLERNLRRAMGTRSAEIGRGLAPVESGVGTLISFSTQPGNVALDGSGRNSPFAGALVKYLANPTEDLSAILIAVRNDVMSATQRQQVPWEHSALTGRFYFMAPSRAESQPGPTLRLSEAAEAWDRVKDTNNIAVLEAFVGRFPGTIYADLAAAKLTDLKKQQIAVLVPRPQPTQPNTPTERVNPQPPTTQPVPVSGQPSWVKLCENVNAAGKVAGDKKDSRTVRLCLTHHERIDGKTGTVIFSAALREIEGQSAKQLLLLVPLGIAQAPGLRVGIYSQELWKRLEKREAVDETQIYQLKLNFSLCHTQGCTAEIDASPETVEWMRRGGGMMVQVLNSEGKPIFLPVPLNSFAAAFGGPPVDNQKYAEQRTQLMRQIQERQKQQVAITPSSPVDAKRTAPSASTPSQSEINTECSKRADAKQLHGEPRKAFREKCKDEVARGR